MSSQLRATLFGRFSLEYLPAGSPAIPIPPLPASKSTSLVAYLLLNADKAQSRAQLATLLWPDQPDARARRSLSTALWHIRGSLPEADWLGGDRHSVRFDPDLVIWTDAGALLKAAASPDPASWAAALADYKGTFLPELDDEWVRQQRAQLAEAARSLAYGLIDHYQGAAAWPELLALCQQMSGYEPLDERIWAGHITALLRLERRQEAVAQLNQVEERLQGELAVAPGPELTQLKRRLAAAAAANVVQLPAPTTAFIGRAKDIGAVEARLQNPDCRLLTILGPGGSGKTRLAIATGRRLAPFFSDGVYFVPLASLLNADLLAATIANSFALTLIGLEPLEDQLIRFLGAKEALLILDNFEHLTSGSGLLSRLLQAAPNLRILVTSRKRLPLAEEWVLELAGLDVPAAEAAHTDLMSYDAIRLFVARCQQIEPGFALTETNAAAVSRICQLVAGLPLGLELAAAWSRQLSAGEIAAEMAGNLDFLSSSALNVPERQRSLAAAFDYSWQLLATAEKGILPRLALFRGGFDRDAAAAVAGADLRQLAALIDSSLLLRTTGGRYDMHELLRQFALAHLPADPSVVEMQYSVYYLEWLAELREALRGPEQIQAQEILRIELENIRQAWTFGLKHKLWPEISGAISPLSNFFERQALSQVGLELLAKTLAASAGDGQVAAHVPELKPLILAHRGSLLFRQGSYKEAIASLEAAIKLYEALAPSQSAFPRTVLGGTLIRQGDYEGALQQLSLAHELYTTVGDRAGLARCCNNLGVLQSNQGDNETACASLEQGLALCEESGDLRLQASLISNLGLVYLRQNQFTASKDQYETALILYRQLADDNGVAICLSNLGYLDYNLGNLHQAEQMQRQALTRRRLINDVWGQALSLMNLGLVLTQMGRFPAATDCFVESIGLSQAKGSPWTQAYALRGLAAVHVQTGRFDDVLAQLAEAETLFTSLHDAPGLAYCRLSRAEALAHRGDSEAARSLYEGLFATTPAVGYVQAAAARGLLHLPAAHLAPERAQELLAASDRILAALDDKLGLASNLIYHARHFAAAGQAAHAEMALKQLLRVSWPESAWPLCCSALVTLAELRLAVAEPDDGPALFELLQAITHCSRASYESRQLAGKLLAPAVLSPLIDSERLITDFIEAYLT